jgi:hypothetical protein
MVVAGAHKYGGTRRPKLEGAATKRGHLGLPSVQLTSYSLGLGARRPGTQSLDDKPPAACCAWVPGVRARSSLGVEEASLRLLPGRLEVRNPFVPSDGGHFKGTDGCTGTESPSGRSTRLVVKWPIGSVRMAVSATTDWAMHVPHTDGYLRRNRRIPYQVAPAAATAPRLAAVMATAVPDGI